MFSSILLQASNTPNSSAVMMQFLVLGGIFLVFYVFIIMPQRRRQAEQQKFRENLKVGDRVVTIGGLHGKITALKDGRMMLQTDEKGTKLEFEISAVSVEMSQRAAQAAAKTSEK